MVEVGWAVALIAQYQAFSNFYEKGKSKSECLYNLDS